jgi:signal transduction histidine kinase/CheY-like chemotaxis protein
MTLEPSTPDFRALFHAVPGLYLVLTPDFRIVAVSDAYLDATMTERNAILDRGIFDAFPDNPDDPAATGVRNLRESLQRVVTHRRSDSMAVQKYDIRRKESEGGGFEVRYWSPVNSPVLSSAGELLYIIHRVEDVTEFIRLKQTGQERERIAEEMLTRAGQMESEIYLRSQELGNANRQLRHANEELERLYRQVSDLMLQADSTLLDNPVESGPAAQLADPITPSDMLARVASLLATHRLLEEQLRQSQKMEAIGRLAGGVAHDFNNLLTVIAGFAELVMNDLPAGDITDAVAEIKGAAIRAANLTKQLLAFSRKQVLQPRLLDLNEIVRGMEELLRRLIGENISLVTVLSSGLYKVKADRGQIEQVIMNLAVNARDAMPNGGRLVIETRTANSGIGDKRALIGPCAILSVSDTGHGMDADTLSRIFEPFFTTKELGNGTGLGLATVYGIVEQSGGTLTVDSRVDHGSIFRVCLPAAAGQKEEIDADVPAAGPRNHSGTLLVVEDETPLRRLICRILASVGYNILEAASGEEAFHLATQNGVAIDLLLTDVLMPGMSGADLMDKLRAHRSELTVLFMSGYDRELVGQRERLPGVAFLPKPFTPQTLTNTVRQMLEEGRVDTSGGISVSA